MQTVNRGVCEAALLETFKPFLRSKPDPSLHCALLTFATVSDETLQDEDEVEVALRVAQCQHGDAPHA